MTQILLGKEVAMQIDMQSKSYVIKLNEIGITPKLGIIRVGKQKDDLSYERSITRKCENLGIDYDIFCLPRNVTEHDLLDVMEQINSNDNIHGILLFRPLPKHLNEEKIINKLNPEKDIDGITDYSIAGIFSGKDQGFSPCTPQSCIEILDYYGISCTGKKIVVVGRSLVVGKPLTMMLINKNATVTVCHTKTKNMEAIIQESDIVIVAAGKQGLIDKFSIKPRQIIIDVGIHVNEDGKISGDVDYEEIKDIVGAITPVPGGVGSVTTSVLIQHVVIAAMRKYI